MPSTNINDIYTGNSNYLKHADLKGGKVNLTIAGASVEEIGEQSKLVLEFEHTEKQLVLNKTNAQMIAFLVGSDDYTNWIGTRITVKPSITEFQGKPTPCIRVADELPPQKNGHRPPPPPADTVSDDDEPPF